MGSGYDLGPGFDLRRRSKEHHLFLREIPPRAQLCLEGPHGLILILKGAKDAIPNNQEPAEILVHAAVVVDAVV